MVLISLSQLNAFVLRWLPGCELPFIQRALQDAVRYLFATHDLWQEDLDPQVIVDYQSDYALSTPSPDPANTPTTYSANIHRIGMVKVNSMEYFPPMYRLMTGNTLRFDSQAVPVGMSSCLLKCGVAGNTTLADWQAITNASLGVTLNNVSYSLSGLNFTGLTFNQIALAIQTAMRAQAKNNTPFCRWFTNRFMLWTEAVVRPGFNSSTVSYLSAGISGTDLSGSSWMNGLSGGTGVSNGPLLQVNAVIRPQQSVETLPDWLLDRASEALIARAIWQLKNMPGPHYDPNGSTIWDTAFNVQVTNLLGDKSRDYNTETLDFGG